jgi:hypothetical protein
MANPQLASARLAYRNFFPEELFGSTMLTKYNGVGHDTTRIHPNGSAARRS